MVPLPYLSLLTAADLDALLMGPTTVDVGSWQKVTQFQGYSAHSMPVQWFWNLVKELNTEDLKLLLLFWSGSSQPPLFGFDRPESEPWTIERLNYNEEQSLPQSSTCSFHLRLPAYSTEEELRKKVLMAIRMGAVGYVNT